MRRKFAFKDTYAFGEINPPLRRKFNFMAMSTEAIEALSEEELRQALTERGIDTSAYPLKQDLVNKAQML